MAIRLPVRLGTRGSDLALWQARWVAAALKDRLGLPCELVILKTTGDLDTSRPIAALGEVGAFTKELERALLVGEVDIAVHSLKDLPTALPPGLVLACRPARAAVQDVLLAHPDAHDGRGDLVPLRTGARVGTSSVRRRVQLLARRPDLVLGSIRGNVPTRVGLARDRQGVDAVILAAAGLDRLALDLRGVVRFDLPPDEFIPAPGQAALGIEARAGDAELLAALRELDDPAVVAATDAERLLLQGIGAGCSVPLGARAEVLPGGEIQLRAVLGPPGEVARPALVRALVRARDPRAAADLALRLLGPHGAAGPGPAADPQASWRPLAGRRVHVARDPERAADLVAALEARGASVTCRAATQERPLLAPGLLAAIDALPRDGWVVLTSVTAARQLARQWGSLGGLGRVRVAAVGAATGRAISDAGGVVDLLAPEGDQHGAGLARALVERAGATRPPVILPAARDGRPELREALHAAGWDVRAFDLYASEPLPPPPPDELAVDALVVSSPSGARATLALGAPPGCHVVAIGPTTADAARALGVSATTAEQPTPAAVVEAVIAALRS